MHMCLVLCCDTEVHIPYLIFYFNKQYRKQECRSRRRVTEVSVKVD